MRRYSPRRRRSWRCGFTKCRRHFVRHICFVNIVVIDSDRVHKLSYGVLRRCGRSVWKTMLGPDAHPRFVYRIRDLSVLQRARLHYYIRANVILWCSCLSGCDAYLVWHVTSIRGQKQTAIFCSITKSFIRNLHFLLLVLRIKLIRDLALNGGLFQCEFRQTFVVSIRIIFCCFTIRTLVLS